MYLMVGCGDRVWRGISFQAIDIGFNGPIILGRQFFPMLVLPSLFICCSSNCMPIESPMASTCRELALTTMGASASAVWRRTRVAGFQ
jgi:hypothetical protein